MLSGLTVEELAAGDGSRRGAGAAAARRARGAPARARRRAADAGDARRGRSADPGWLFELKYDGYRLLAGKAATADAALLAQRPRRDRGLPRDRRGDARAAVSSASCSTARSSCSTRSGRPSFQRLQQRGQLAPRRRHRARRADAARDATTRSICSRFGGYDLRALPLSERKALLAQLVPAVGPDPLRRPRRRARASDCSRRSTARARGRGRQARGLRRTRGRPLAATGSSWRALDARFRRRRLHARPRAAAAASARCTWRVGRRRPGLRGPRRLGLRRALLTARRRRDARGAAARRAPPVAAPCRRAREHAWVEPALVVEVRYRESRRDGLLRQPVFLRLRDDKALRASAGPPEAEDSTAPPTSPRPPRPRTRPRRGERRALTNLDKVFWPERRLHQGRPDRVLPRVARGSCRTCADRPLVLTRYPDGIDGKSSSRRTRRASVARLDAAERCGASTPQREIRLLRVRRRRDAALRGQPGLDPAARLVAAGVAILAAPRLVHPRSRSQGRAVRARGRAGARASTSCATISGCRRSSRPAARPACTCWCRSARQLTYEQCAHARRAAGRGHRASAARHRHDRASGRLPRRAAVYVDYLQNGHGRLLVAPFSVRPVPGAPVSMPLTWARSRRGSTCAATT